MTAETNTWECPYCHDTFIGSGIKGDDDRLYCGTTCAERADADALRAELAALRAKDDKRVTTITQLYADLDEAWRVIDHYIALLTGQQARIREDLFIEDELYDHAGKVVTLKTFVAPESDPAVWTCLTEHGVYIDAFPDELEPLTAPQDATAGGGEG